MRKVGLIGCGAIGTVIARAVERRIVECDEIILYDYKKEKSEKLMNSLTVPVTIVNNVKEMLVLKPQVVVEAASQQAVIEYADQILNEKVDLIVMSTHGKTGISRWFSGSVAEKVVSQSLIPVLVVTPPGCRISK